MKNPLKKSEKGDSASARAARKVLENEILEANKATHEFKTNTRFAVRAVAKPDGWIRAPGFTPDKVYWIVETDPDGSQGEIHG